MPVESIRELLSHRPFEPFEVHMSNGDIHQIKHPEMATLTKTRLVIADFDKDRLAICSLLHIASVQMLQTA